MLSPGCIKHLTGRLSWGRDWRAPLKQLQFGIRIALSHWWEASMPLIPSRAFVSLTLAVLTFPAVGAPAKKSLRPESLAGAVVWQDPGDIASRDLYYGPGGEKDQPHGPFTFEKEDLDGSNPKFVVRDRDGVKWKVKLGTEARPETVASRLVWSVGYFTDEDYFLADFKADAMPAHLHRGQELV